jgi:hypothetical protein
MSTMNVAEFGLWAVLGLLFWKRGFYRRFPAMGTYLALRVVSAPLLLVTYYIQSLPWGRSYFQVYFFTYWLVYIASAVLLLMVCIEVFRSALSGLPGLMKIGIVIFRWAVLVSVVLTFSSVSFVHRGILIIPDIARGLMRSVSLLELFLPSFVLA